jgi:hypothetical protein
VTEPLRFKKKSQPLILISNSFYDFLKALVMVVLPGAAALYLGVSTAFDLSWSIFAVVLGLLITVALGIFLLISSRFYVKSDLKYDGTMMVSQNETGEMLYSLELDDSPEILRLKSHICFKVLNDSIEDRS